MNPLDDINVKQLIEERNALQRKCDQMANVLRNCWRRPDDKSDLAAVVRITMEARKCLSSIYGETNQ